MDVGCSSSSMRLAAADGELEVTGEAGEEGRVEAGEGEGDSGTDRGSNKKRHGGRRR